MRSRRSHLGVLLVLVIAALGVASGCGENTPSRVAARVLDRYRRTTGSKPLTASGMIRLRLARDGDAAVTGRDEIDWAPRQYRETVSSAGMTVVHGIQSGRAYFIDQDGVARVVSDPVLRELRTRSYFWRRAWLFTDHEGAWLELGPADAATVSLDLTPEGGNALRLTFSRSDGRLLSARSPRFALEFSSTTAFRDVSDPTAPVAAEVAWIGLPTGPFPEASNVGGKARFEASDGVPLERRAGSALVPATLSGKAVRLAIDGAEDGPVAVSPSLAASLPVSFSPDVFGRSVAPGAMLSVAGATWPALWVQRAEALPPGADAVAGACLFREAVVELDLAARRLRLHDPTSFAPPEGYFRIPIDDDGNRPVAILNRGKKDLRLTAASDTGEVALLLAQASARRAGYDGTTANGLAWGPVVLPELPIVISGHGFFPDWGDDGRLGFPLLSRFHAFVHMPQRWIYVQPVEK
ncbi:MAG TPA: hypothetical protein VKG23_08975 [Thermoanaerobaculia bacterium]|nr:hypothetical protein [Thermoanaerobaculia bacterium]